MKCKIYILYRVIHSQMKYNKYTHYTAITMLILYSIYALFSTGIMGILLSAAVGLLSASYFDNIETIAIVVILFGIVYSMYVKLQSNMNRTVVIKGKQNEGFVSGESDLSSITNRIDSMNKKYRSEPSGVYSSFVEGFEDAQVPDADSTKDGEKSTSEPADPKKIMNEIESPLVDDEKNKEKDDKKQIETFKHSGPAQNGLFKLGEFPSESKDGPQIDVGGTFLKAMSALNPEQINAMTQDTKELLETQKSLITMFQGMAPILKDGKNLLDTFSGMFGGSMPAMK
jgi:hypothetical protein